MGTHALTAQDEEIAGSQREGGRPSAVRLLDEMLEGAGGRDFAVRLWDGAAVPAADGGRGAFTLLLNTPGALRSMFVPPSDLSLGEAYIYGDFDVEGDLERVFDVFDRLRTARWDPQRVLRLAAGLVTQTGGSARESGRAARVQGAAHSRERDKQAIGYHYDVGNDFYRLWLDDRMVYSCAYFPEPETPLDDAQTAKLDLICRKLDLHPGDTLLDIGCGWGGLVTHAAENYGVQATGVTLSEEQAAYAEERVARLGLGDSCRIEVRDYRDLDGTFDKVASVGMFEHVGEGKLPDYFGKVCDVLAPDGLFLNHGIATEERRPKHNRETFIQRYVFPDGELLPLASALSTAWEAGFEVRDVESLREHYAATLRHWVSRLERQERRACDVTCDVTYRIWKLYMTGAAHAFSEGTISVYQTLLAKRDGASRRPPVTRKHWYAAES